jgi:nitrate reductase delta subunit
MTGQAKTDREIIDEGTAALRVLALLLHYPDGDLFDNLGEIASAAEHMQPTEMQSAVKMFVEYLRRQPLIQAQENYTAAFDMDPGATLNMSYHVHGDNEERAAALACLQRSYERAGWERATGELPDYLPLMLEFLAVCGHPAHAGAVWECLQGLGKLTVHLEKKAPVYAALLHPLAQMAADRRRGPSTSDVPGGNHANPQEMRP